MKEAYGKSRSDEYKLHTRLSRNGRICNSCGILNKSNIKSLSIIDTIINITVIYTIKIIDIILYSIFLHNNLRGNDKVYVIITIINK